MKTPNNNRKQRPATSDNIEIYKFPVTVSICKRYPTEYKPQSYHLLINEMYTCYLHEHVAHEIIEDLQLQDQAEYLNTKLYAPTECELIIKYHQQYKRYTITILKDKQKRQYHIQRSQAENHLIPKIHELFKPAKGKILNIF